MSAWCCWTCYVAKPSDLRELPATRPAQVLPRDQILDMAHHKDDEPLDRSIDIRAARLRRKIEVDPAKPDRLETERGVGYVF